MNLLRSDHMYHSTSIIVVSSMPYLCFLQPVSCTTYHIPEWPSHLKFLLPKDVECRMLNAYSPFSALPTYNRPNVSICGRNRRHGWLNARNEYVLSPHITNHPFDTFPAALSPQVVVWSCAFSFTPEEALVARYIPSAIQDCTWGHMIRPLSSCRRRRDKMMGALPKVTMMEVVSILIDKYLLESAATAGNRRRVFDINNGGGDGASEMI